MTHRLRRAFLGLLPALLLSACSESTQPPATNSCEDYRPASHPLWTTHTPGIVWAGDTQGEYAYMVSSHDLFKDPAFHVARLSPVGPAEVLGSLTVSSQPLDVKSQGNLAYVLLEDALLVVEVSAPRQPRELARLDLPGPSGSSLGSLLVTRTHAYVGLSDRGLFVVDLARPDRPQVIATLPLAGRLSDLEIKGASLLAALGETGYAVIDVADPKSPAVQAAFDDIEAWGFALRGDLLHVAAGGSGVHVFDAASPVDPRPVGEIRLTSGSYAVSTSGSHVLSIGRFGRQIQVVSMERPEFPILVERIDTPSFPASIHASEGLILAGLTSGGFMTSQLAAGAAAASHIGSLKLNVQGDASDIAIQGDYAYVLFGRTINVVDISDLAHPRLMGSADMQGLGTSLDVAGDYAYVAHASQGLYVVDVSDPTQPVVRTGRKQSLRLQGGQPVDVVIHERHAYVPVYWASSTGMYIVDVSDLENLRVVDFVETLGAAWDVAIVGDTAYLTDGLYLNAVDISVPEEASVVGSTLVPGFTTMVPKGDYLLVAANGEYLREEIEPGLHLVDISSPHSPVLVTTLNITGISSLNGMAVAGDYAYVAHGGFGVQVVDVSEPGSLYLVGDILAQGAKSMVAGPEALFVGGLDDIFVVAYQCDRAP